MTTNDELRAAIRKAAGAEGSTENAVDGLLDQASEVIHAWTRQRLAAMIDAERNAQHVSDPRQGWLALKEFEHISAAVQNDSLERFREGTHALAIKIRTYGYRRISAERIEREKAELRERRLLESRIEPYFENDPDMTVGRAAEIYRRHLEGVEFRHANEKSTGTRAGLESKRVRPKSTL